MMGHILLQGDITKSIINLFKIKFSIATQTFSSKIGTKNSYIKGFSLEMKGLTHSFLFESRIIYLFVRGWSEIYQNYKYYIVKNFLKRQDGFTNAHLFNM